MFNDTNKLTKPNDENAFIFLLLYTNEINYLCKESLKKALIYLHEQTTQPTAVFR